MNLRRIAILVLFLVLFILPVRSFAQYPQQFTYDDENGLPSNEVYSIAQDKKGFIWIGCDAGLYKFDGIRYIPYKCAIQKSKSVTGLTISSSGKLYCSNFNAQLFALDNDTLKELDNKFSIIITSVTADNAGNLFVSHFGGIDVFNETAKTWKRFGVDNPDLKVGKNDWVSKSTKFNSKGEVFALRSDGVLHFENNGFKTIITDLFKEKSPGFFLPEYHNDELWVFNGENNVTYKCSNGLVEEFKSEKLSSLLHGKKITAARSLTDGMLWICTYKGIIKYDAKNDTGEILYPDFSFSDCLIDREGNYWFSTLQTGLLRIVALDMPVWNKLNAGLSNEKISKLICTKDVVYFASINGAIGQLNTKTDELKMFHTGKFSDVQSFDFDSQNNTLWFNIDNQLFYLKDGKIGTQDNIVTAIKVRKQFDNYTFIGSSSGIYINNERISNLWTREIEFDKAAGTPWLATNKGLLGLLLKNDKWEIKYNLLPETQILSVDVDEAKSIVYALAFDGSVYSVSANGKTDLICKVNEKSQVVKLKQHNSKLFFATNKGLLIYDTQEKKWEAKNRMSGLSSENIQDIAVDENNIWLATGKGLQKIPLASNNKSIAPLLYLKKVLIADKLINEVSGLKLNYGEPLLIYPEAVAYSSATNFWYAYRIKSADTNWIKLPATIDVIDVMNIPSGDFEVEIKVINHQNVDSENIILLSGYVKPPFWKSTWFIVLIMLLAVVIVFVLFLIRIRKIKAKQRLEIERITLENELRLSRETALKSQMNPHFIFNVLNSIKAYIYKNDKQKATEYLNDFSNLIRTFLNMSNSSFISISDELKMMKLYINMEAMLLKDDFTYLQNVDENIDLAQTKIPSIIIQPFVENAFKHGLHHKEGNKQLTLNVFSGENNAIIIEIIDNGIGRTHAQEIKNAEKINHQSFATTAIQKRIDLLNKDGNLVDVSIVDLSNNNSACGTKVIIKIETDE
ncbi:MAG: histidine kinase [Bacteroidetes bacterium]|nr:histidine kinase [Bacteroidota bacterium]